VNDAPTPSAAPSAAPAAVVARPIRMGRVGYGAAAFLVVVFLVVALVMRHASAGAHFGVKDQVGTGVLGVILGGLCLMLTRPRLIADREGVRMRSFLGGWRTVPWDVVVAVDFPPSVRFARLRLPGEETLALYAVQRLDAEQAVAVMRGLRALHEASRQGHA